MPSEFSSAPSVPLLTIAIPTYNRAASLELLLRTLAPQLAERPEVDLFISDNASSDETPEIVHGFIEDGLAVRYVRQVENIGSDRNFVTCFEAARGRYFWLCGDDDVILPGTIERVLYHLAGPEPVDLMLLAGYGFHSDPIAEHRDDPLGRKFQVFTDPYRFAQIVNIAFTFISAIVVNRERLLELPHESPRALMNTNLVQLSWCLPLLLHHRRSIAVWERSIAAQQGNAGGYNFGHVFGRNLRNALSRLLPDRQDIQRIILNFTLRRWMPSMTYSFRMAKNEQLGLEAAAAEFHQAYGDNFRYWLFAHPIFILPLPLAGIWMRLGTAVNYAVYILTVPRFWRREG
jgi:abequosyltransferase